MPAASPDRLVLLGVFGAPQGVRGEVRVKSFTAEAKAIGGYGTLTDAVGGRRFVFEALRPLKDDMMVARVAGVTTREAAAELTGVEIFARRSQLPPPDADEFYYDDLVGLAAVTPDGVALGRVSALVNYGAGDILEVKPEGVGDTRLFPFTKAVVVDIDFEAGRVVVAPPEEVEGEEARGEREPP